MARPLRIEYEGAHYHVTSRGNERKAIFRDDTDREKFLELTGRGRVQGLGSGLLILISGLDKRRIHGAPATD